MTKEKLSDYELDAHIRGIVVMHKYPPEAMVKLILLEQLKDANETFNEEHLDIRIAKVREQLLSKKRMFEKAIEYVQDNFRTVNDKEVLPLENVAALIQYLTGTEVDVEQLRKQ